MKPFLAIVKLTFRHALRSHVFQLLLALLVLAVVFIPGTVGAGTAADFIRISLFYSLGTLTFILALSSMWLGCYAMTHDVESYQLHLVVTKPVSRVTVWTGKWIGVTLVNLLLLLLAAAAIYGIVLYRFSKGDFPEEERTRIRNEVLVGRRVFLPRRADLGQMAREIVRTRSARLKESGREVDLSPANQERLLRDAAKEAYSTEAEVRAGARREWVFENLPESVAGQPMYFRYRPYVDKIATSDQRMTRIWWMAGVPRLKNFKTDGVSTDEKAGFEVYMLPISDAPDQVMSGEFHEKLLLPEWKLLTPDRKVYIGLVNFDYSKSSQFYQVADGPKLLIRVTSFGENYFRAVLVIALGLLIVAGFGCTFGGFLSLPTAVFVVASYILFGSFSLFMVGQSYIKGASAELGLLLAKGLLLIVVPLQAFDVTGLVSNGELVEWSRLGGLVWSYLILRAVPLFIIGILLYRRRELGLVIRK